MSSCIAANQLGLDALLDRRIGEQEDAARARPTPPTRRRPPSSGSETTLNSAGKSRRATMTPLRHSAPRFPRPRRRRTARRYQSAVVQSFGEAVAARSRIVEHQSR